MGKALDLGLRLLEQSTPKGEGAELGSVPLCAPPLPSVPPPPALLGLGQCAAAVHERKTVGVVIRG